LTDAAVNINYDSCVCKTAN